MHDYTFTSPSLEGILSHSSVSYEGVTRPIEIFKILDGPRYKSEDRQISAEEQKILGQYFQDLYGVFQKKLLFFVSESAYSPADALKLQAMLQELAKVKRLLGREIKA
jgi:hypothetical protein